jgi:hypothetical protein
VRYDSLPHIGQSLRLGGIDPLHAAYDRLQWESVSEERRETVQRLLRESMEDPRATARPLSGRARQTARSLEAYLRAGIRPRWMERLMEIEAGIARERRHLARVYDTLRAECEEGEFARRWRAVAAAWSFELNELIRTHNEWYPVERDLPMDLRTRDYVLINGRSYRRRELDADWILEQFPAT